MKYSLCIAFTLFAATVSAQVTTDAIKELDCTKHVATYIDGLQTGYNLNKTPETKQRLDAAKLIQKNMTACAAEDYLLANSKAAIKASDEAVATKSNKQ